MLTIVPRLLAAITGMATRDIRTAPITITLYTLSQSASDKVSTEPGIEAAALLTRMSTPPNVLVASSTTRWQSSGSDTSAMTVIAFAPVRVTSSAVSRTRSASMSVRTSLAPCSARTLAMALPTPTPSPNVPAPVMMATRFSTWRLPYLEM